MSKTTYLLGIDLGSSSVKASVVETPGGTCVASACSPATEMNILSPGPGRAEQDPAEWEKNAAGAIGMAMKKAGISGGNVAAIGIAYQMHGLVCVGRDGRVLRPSIIWCDSRAVDTGASAFASLGKEYCLTNLLNSPGNFTASKLAWVKQNEPSTFEKTDNFLLPGDWLAFRMTGEKFTTRSGLSEGVFWDFRKRAVSSPLCDLYGIPAAMIPETCETFGIQGRITKEAAERFGLPEGIPVTYRSGDQPNNAFSLRALEPGDIAATAGTSGVVYSVSREAVSDKFSRVNTFVHVNDTASDPRTGILLCINGTGISNSWIKKISRSEGYPEMNRVASAIPPGSEGLLFIPFGNGAERMLGNRMPGASFEHLDFTRHSEGHLFRAVQEGIAFAFRYGTDILNEMGIIPSIIRAGQANLFLSKIFTHTLAGLAGVDIELYNTDGATGAALGAGIGAGIYSSAEEAFSGLRCIETISPGNDNEFIRERYFEWENILKSKLQE